MLVLGLGVAPAAEVGGGAEEGVRPGHGHVVAARVLVGEMVHLVRVRVRVRLRVRVRVRLRVRVRVRFRARVRARR